jgi:hypothetical protein
MNLKSNLKEIVEQINRQLSISDSYSERRLLQILEHEDPLIFSEDGFDFFLIPIENESMKEQERLDGLFIMIANKFLKNNMDKEFLVIKTQSSRRELFVPFISELICKDLSNPIDALEETLKEWRDFWSGKRARLSKHEQIGLIGELLTLSKLILHSGPNIVEKWGGPLDWLHDFESDKLDLEIKTTTKQPDSVYISQISQVAPMLGNKKLQLVVIGLEEGDEINLPGMVKIIRTKLANSRKINHFEKVLNRSGYRDSEKHHYMHNYSLAYIKCHEITNDSPVLKPTLLGDIPNTVADIKYNLLTHAMDMIDVSDEVWLEFCPLM